MGPDKRPRHRSFDIAQAANVSKPLFLTCILFISNTLSNVNHIFKGAFFEKLKIKLLYFSVINVELELFLPTYFQISPIYN